MSVIFKGTRSDLMLNLNTRIDNWCTNHIIHKSTNHIIHKSNLSEWKRNVSKLLDKNTLELSRQTK